MEEARTSRQGAEDYLPKKLRAAYWDLGDEEEVVLLALAMFGAPLSSRAMSLLCQHLEKTYRSRVSFKKVVPRLIESGLVESVQEGPRKNDFAVLAQPKLRPWGLAAAEHRLWGRLSDACEKWMQEKAIWPNECTALVRFAVAAGNIQLTNHLLHNFDDFWVDGCVSIARDAADENFECIHPSLWLVILKTLQTAAQDAPETEHLTEVLRRGIRGQSPKWPAVACDALRFELNALERNLSLLRGDLALAEKLCELQGGITAMGLALRWLRGAYDTSEYVARRMAGPSATKKRKKTKPTWPERSDAALGEAFYAMALLAEGSEASLREALRLVRTERKHAGPIQPLPRRLEELICWLLDKPIRFDPRDVFAPVQAADGLTELLSAIVLVWIGEYRDDENDDEPDDELMDEHDLHWEMLESDDAPWLQRQWLAVLHRIDPSKAQRVEQKLGSAAVFPERELCLVDLLKSKSHWERQFEAIERSLSGQAESSHEAEQRLAWFVSADDVVLDIEPRLQKRTKAGYTRGRRVALKRLYEGEEPCTLSEQDQRVIRCIESEVSPRHYGYYTQTEYDLGDDALVQLVGHPWVFDQATGEPLAVQEGTPQISLAEDSSGLRFVAIPPSDDAVSYTRRDGVLVVYALTKKQQELFAKVLRAGRFPPEARDRATQLLESMSGTIHTLDANAVLGNVRTVTADQRPVFQLTPQRGGLTVQIVVRPFASEGTASEGAASAGPFFSPGAWPATVRWDVSGGESLAAVRDLDEELTELSNVLAVCPTLAGYLEERHRVQAEIRETEHLLETITELNRCGAQMEWPEGARINIKRASRGKVKVTRVRNNDWLEAQISVELDEGDKLQELELLQALRGGRRFMALSDGSFAELENGLRDRLQRLDAFASPEEEAGLYHPFAALELDADETVEVQGGESWQKRRQELAARLRKKIRLPSGLKTELRDYQKEGVRWALRLANLGAGACLADDMGLGKTVQALAVMLVRGKEGPALVLAPSSVIGNWRRELAEFAPALNVTVLSEVTARTAERKRRLPALGAKDVLLATYDLAVREVDGLKDVSWASLVIDEAQAIKNPDTRRARAVVQLPAGFCMALSGTPVENHLGELWSLFRVLNPTLLGSRKVFEARFQKPIEQSEDSAKLDQLKALVAPFLLRRTKETVLSSLPARTEVTWEVELSKSERRLYEAARLDAVQRLEEDEDVNKNPLQILKELLRLRQLCCHPRLALPNSDVPSSKHAALMELLQELRENGHRALVFSQFVQHLSLVRELLDTAGFTYQYLDGSTPTRERTRRIEAFQDGAGELFLISLKAGGTGINLTAADYVIHLDPWWNPAVEDQASDRAHRIGQTKPVTVYRLVAKDTIEEKLIALHTSKRELADQVLSGGQAAAQISGEELLRLMAGS